MISNEPLFSIETVPYLVDCDHRDHLLVVGFDEDDTVVSTSAFRLDVARPLDDASLEVVGWPSTTTSLIAIAYSDTPELDFRPLLAAADASHRTVVHALRAGTARWRSYTCRRTRCCPRAGNRYAHTLPGHSDYRPLPLRGADPSGWRSAMWDTWQDALRAPVAGMVLSDMARSLFDVPLRDAVLAQSAREQGLQRPGIRDLLTTITERSPLATALPAYTCRAAMAYLDGDLTAAKDMVNAVLSIDDYSLARLLRNGLEMRAPASLLARSFAHFDPIELLAA